MSTPVELRWLTRANALTGLRLMGAPLLAHAVLAEQALLAFAVFWGAVVTDLLDGRVARRYGEVSPLGGLLDHATDAAFVTAGLGAVACTGEVPVLLPWLVALAFLQYTLDSRALAGQPLRASQLGRWNGIAYFVLLGVPVVRDALGIGWPDAVWVEGAGWALVASSLVSMGDRALAPEQIGEVAGGRLAADPVEVARAAERRLALGAGGCFARDRRAAVGAAVRLAARVGRGVR